MIVVRVTATVNRPVEAGPDGRGGWRVRASVPARVAVAAVAVAPVIRLLIADDQAPVRDGLRMLLSGEPDIDLVGEAVDGADLAALARSRRPDVVLTDIRMPGTDGLATSSGCSPSWGWRAVSTPPSTPTGTGC